MSFSCDHCGFSNNEIQAAGEIQNHGARYVLRMDQLPDMERQIVKSDSAVFRIEDLDLEVPAGRGRLTNIEGILADILRDLENPQKARKQEDPELYEKIECIVQLLMKMMMGGRYPYTISLDDPAGNSWIEPSPLDTDGKYTRTEYVRSPEQNIALGLVGDDQVSDTHVETAQVKDDSLGAIGNVFVKDVDGGVMRGVNILNGQLYTIPTQCPGCAKFAEMNLTMINVPYFKEVIVSALVCAHCGYRTNDVKTGGEFPKKGQRIWLDVESSIDLRRDILKSETCFLKIPACSVEVQPGTMGGRFTTVEGLLTQIRDDLHGSIFDVDDAVGAGGDSMAAESKSAWDSFFAKIDSAIRGDMKYTILMEDPLANSYVQSLTAPEADPQITIEEYERTVQEEEELGLTDMRTQLNSNGEYTKEDPNQMEAHPSSKIIDAEATATPGKPGPESGIEATDDTNTKMNIALIADVSKSGQDT